MSSLSAGDRLQDWELHSKSSFFSLLPLCLTFLQGLNAYVSPIKVYAKLFFITLYMCVCVCADTHAYACVHVCMHVYAKECVCRPEDNIVEMTLPSTMWDLWIKLRMLVLVANVFICQVILLSCVPILIPQGDDIWRL